MTKQKPQKGLHQQVNWLLYYFPFLKILIFEKKKKKLAASKKTVSKRDKSYQIVLVGR